MRVVHIILPGASAYELKSEAIDRGLFDAEIVPIEAIRETNFDVAHIYGPRELPSSPFAGFPRPYVANGDLPRSRWSWRKPVPPARVITPFEIGEAVEDRYFEVKAQLRDSETKTIGSFARRSVRDFVQRTMARIQRFRSDVIWNVFSHPPTPEDLLGVDAWIDPAMDEHDYDGFTAEALVVGLPVVASRTPINDLRLEKNRTGFLVPVNDPNEMTHAILAALFKPEVAQQKIVAARQTAPKFRSGRRGRSLKSLYENLN